MLRFGTERGPVIARGLSFPIILGIIFCVSAVVILAAGWIIDKIKR